MSVVYVPLSLYCKKKNCIVLIAWVQGDVISMSVDMCQGTLKLSINDQNMVADPEYKPDPLVD